MSGKGERKEITNEFGCFGEIIVAYSSSDELAWFLGLVMLRKD